MNLRLICYTIIAVCLIQTAAQAAVLHITQRETVYYGDAIDLRGITGWANSLAWWARNHDPTQDPPDAYINITKYERYTITDGTHAGMWFQWYGHNERNPVAVFYVVPRVRGEAVPTPEPTPEPNVTVQKKAVNPQPNPIADILIARHDSLSYFLGGNAQVWLMGPSLVMLGNRTENWLNLTGVTLAPGKYTMLIQRPDANGIFEVYADGNQIINSTWKDVPGVWHGPLGVQPLEAKLRGMFADTAHFHGTVEERSIVVEEQRADVTGLVPTWNNSLTISGITNLAQGDTVTAIFDENRSVTALDRAKATAYGNVTGGIAGAYRLWQVTLKVNLQQQQAGVNHYISVMTPDGTKTIVPFYLSEAYVPFPVENKTIKYVNNSPFVPTPTPLVIEKQVPVTVIQTITVPVTPEYSVVLQAQQEAAAAERETLQNTILSWVLGSGSLVLGGFVIYRGGKYLKDVVRRARAG